jgi:hypothetical protein
MRVDLLEEHHPQISFYIQIKGMGPKTRNGKVQPIETRAGHVSKAIELEHLDYYMKLPVPVFLIVVDVVGRVAYYVHVQRYVLGELMGDDWKKRLGVYKAIRESGDSVTPPTKTIRVPSKNVLSDTKTFKGVVRDAKGFMASLSVKEGIAYREEALRRLDDRFEVTFIKSKDGEGFQLEPKEPIEITMRAKLPKEKFETMFGKGLPVEIKPGELTFQGSPHWEKINAGAKSLQMKQQHRGFINLIRLDGTGQPISRIEYLYCDIEGGRDEWRIKCQFPNQLVTISFNLNLVAIRDNPKGRMNSNFKYKLNMAGLQGRRILSLPLPEMTPALYSGIVDTDGFRIELGIEGSGVFLGFVLGPEANELFVWIGTLHETLRKARAVARHFGLDPRMPAEFSEDDLNQIDFLFGLIQCREVLNPRPFNTMTVTIDRASLAANLNYLTGKQLGQIALQSEADFPFLDETIHVENLVHEISNARQLTRKSDLNRGLKAGSDSIRLRFSSTKDSKHTVRLGNLSEEKVVSAEIKNPREIGSDQGN